MTAPPSTNGDSDTTNSQFTPGVASARARALVEPPPRFDHTRLNQAVFILVQRLVRGANLSAPGPSAAAAAAGSHACTHARDGIVVDGALQAQLDVTHAATVERMMAAWPGNFTYAMHVAQHHVKHYRASASAAASAAAAATPPAPEPARAKATADRPV